MTNGANSFLLLWRNDSKYKGPIINDGPGLNLFGERKMKVNIFQMF